MTQINKKRFKINQRLEYGTQRNCLSALKVLWNFASSTGILGEAPGENPGTHVVLKKPRILKNPSSVYMTKSLLLKTWKKYTMLVWHLQISFLIKGSLLC